MKIIIHPHPEFDRGPCAPMALACVLEIDYLTVNNWLMEMGYRTSFKKGTATRRLARKDAPNLIRVGKHNLRFVPLLRREELVGSSGGHAYTQIEMVPQYQGITVSRFSIQGLPGRYIIQTSGHWLCQIDGIIHDVKDSSRCRIQRVWLAETGK